MCYTMPGGWSVRKTKRDDGTERGARQCLSWVCREDLTGVGIRLKMGWMVGEGRIEKYACAEEGWDTGFSPWCLEVLKTVREDRELGVDACLFSE